MVDAQRSPEVSVVMPCLNEAETLATCIRKARNSLDQAEVEGEVIVADNGSSDGSREIARAEGARVVPVAAKGYGSAIKGGIRAARGSYIIMGDADDSYDFSNLMPYVTKLREGYDLVMGNRFAGGIRDGAMPFLHRYLGNPVLSTVGRLFFGCPCRDFHCGMRGFRRDAVERLDLRTTGMEFASEMVVKATLLELRIAEVPTTLSPDGRTRPPHLRTWRDGWRHLRFLLLYSPRWLFLYPGLLLMLLGAATGIWLLPGARSIGNVTFDIHTLLYSAAAVSIGFQSMVFAIFTRKYAVSAKLLPPKPRLDRFLNAFSLERGLLSGTVFVLCGFIGSVAAVILWGKRDFGFVDPFLLLRVAIPSVLLLILGFQIMLASFFLSVLDLDRQ